MFLKKLGLVLVLISSALWAAPKITVYKTPNCGCCVVWEKALKKAGFTTEVVNKNNLYDLKRELGVPPHLSACHTAVMGNYVLEGHIPLSAISKLLDRKPKNIKGIAVAGMPRGSLGMEFGNKKDSYNVIAIKNTGQTFVFESHQQANKFKF